MSFTYLLGLILMLEIQDRPSVDLIFYRQLLELMGDEIAKEIELAKQWETGHRPSSNLTFDKYLTDLKKAAGYTGQTKMDTGWTALVYEKMKPDIERVKDYLRSKLQDEKARLERNYKYVLTDDADAVDRERNEMKAKTAKYQYLKAIVSDEFALKCIVDKSFIKDHANRVAHPPFDVSDRSANKYGDITMDERFMTHIKSISHDYNRQRMWAALNNPGVQKHTQKALRTMWLATKGDPPLGYKIKDMEVLTCPPSPEQSPEQAGPSQPSMPSRHGATSTPSYVYPTTRQSSASRDDYLHFPSSSSHGKERDTRLPSLRDREDHSSFSSKRHTEFSSKRRSRSPNAHFPTPSKRRRSSPNRAYSPATRNSFYYGADSRSGNHSGNCYRPSEYDYRRSHRRSHPNKNR